MFDDKITWFDDNKSKQTFENVNQSDKKYTRRNKYLKFGTTIKSSKCKKLLGVCFDNNLKCGNIYKTTNKKQKVLAELLFQWTFTNGKL